MKDEENEGSVTNMQHLQVFIHIPYPKATIVIKFSNASACAKSVKCVQLYTNWCTIVHELYMDCT